MKRFTSILFLTLLLAAQYAKQLSYLGCQLYNTGAASTQKCDCENIAKVNNNHSDNANQPAAHQHLVIADYDANVVSTKLPLCPVGETLIFRAATQNNLCNGYLNQMQKPPQV